MILVDFSQIVFSNLHQHMASTPVMDEDLLRHMIINSLRGHNKSRRKKFGDTVICIDSRKYWRKEEFSLYKYNRAQSREANEAMDWDAFFALFDDIKNDIREYFPYKVIEVEGAEGDDIIGTLAMKYAIHEPIMIISSDHDFKQLQKFKGVEQYSPMQKKKVVSKHPSRDLKEKIIRGDKGDGIPNVFSPDDFFTLEGVRAKPIFVKKLDVWLGQEPSMFLNEAELKRYKQNEMLIDLTLIPDHIRSAIVAEFDKPIKGSRMKLLTYLSKKKMRVMTTFIEDF